ncbi:MAG: hypothetical protein NC320_01650 [Clostridium sp.]|nr:hypothetical protein [Clostridium sp.]
MDKPISLKNLIAYTKALKQKIDKKVDKISGRGLSTNDFTDDEKSKLSGIEVEAQKNSITGVKGNAEGSYRTGNVNLTLANIGAASASHTHNYAGSASAGGAANSAVKLDASAGTATQPIYFSDGKPAACTYTLSKSVPADAKFTDTNTVYTHPTSSGNKHIPSGGSSGQILRWSADGTAAWGADNNTTYSNFVKSGTGAKSGLVPAPSTTAGTTKYLREDGTWQVPPDNNTDTKVTETNTTTSGAYRLLLSGNANDTTETTTARKSTKFTANPSTGELTTSKITSSLQSSTYLAANQGTAIINSTAAKGFNMLAKMNSTNGVFTHGVYNEAYRFYYTPKTTIDAGTNSVSKTVTLLNESGNTEFPGTVTASTFSGSLSGNATGIKDYAGSTTISIGYSGASATATQATYPAVYTSLSGTAIKDTTWPNFAEKLQSSGYSGFKQEVIYSIYTSGHSAISWGSTYNETKITLKATNWNDILWEFSMGNGEASSSLHYEFTCTIPVRMIANGAGAAYMYGNDMGHGIATIRKDANTLIIRWSESYGLWFKNNDAYLRLELTKLL